MTDLANEKAKATPGMAIVENNIAASAVPGMAIVENNIAASAVPGMAIVENNMYASVIPGMAIVEADEADVFDISHFPTTRQVEYGIDYSFDTNVDMAFRYENAGYIDKILTSAEPAAPNDTQSHNGLAITASKNRAKMFNIPETKEFWLKFDAWIADTSKDFRVYAYNKGANNDVTGVRINSSSSASTPWIHGNSQSDIKKSYDGLHTFLLHVKSDKTKGVFELYDESGLVSSFKDVNINQGEVFKGLYIQSDYKSVYVSNIILSNVPVAIEENAKLEKDLIPLSKLTSNGVIGEDDVAIARSDNDSGIYHVFNGTIDDSGYRGYLYKDFITIYLKDKYDIEYLCIHNNDDYNCNVSLFGSYDNKNFVKIAESGTSRDENRIFYKVPYFPYYHLCCDNSGASADAIHVYGHKSNTADYIYDTSRKHSGLVENLFDTNRDGLERVGLCFDGSSTYADVPILLHDCEEWSISIRAKFYGGGFDYKALEYFPTIFSYNDAARGVYPALAVVQHFKGLGVSSSVNTNGWTNDECVIADDEPHTLTFICRNQEMSMSMDGRYLGSHKIATFTGKEIFRIGYHRDNISYEYGKLDLLDFQVTKDGKVAAHYVPTNNALVEKKLTDVSGNHNDAMLKGKLSLIDYPGEPTIYYFDAQREIDTRLAIADKFDAARKVKKGTADKLDTSRKLGAAHLEDFDSRRSVLGNTLDDFDTVRKPVVESPDQFDTQRATTIDDMSTADTNRKTHTDFSAASDSARNVLVDSENELDTYREVKTLIDALNVFDTGRELYAVPLNEFDTQRMVHTNFSMTNDYDTARKLKGDHAEDFDADRKLVGAFLDSFDSKRSTTAEQLDSFDSARAIMREAMNSADTYRSLQAELEDGFDSRRAVANNAEDAFDSQRNISNEAAGEFDSARKTSAQTSSGFDSARNISIESEGDYGTARTVNAYDTEAFNTARKTAVDTADAFDSMRKTSTNATGSLDTSRQVQAGASCTGDTERDVHADAFAEVNTSRKTTCDVTAQNDTSRKPVAKEEDMFDTCVEYIVTNFFFDTSRKITIPRYDGFNTVHKEVVGAVNEIYADLKCARRAAAEADLKAQKNKESIAELNAKVASIKVIGGGSSVEGPAGPKGDRGDVGPAGPSGVDGKSAMDIANELRLKKGYKPFASEEDFIESLRGKPGEDGRDGRDGTDAYIDPASLADNSALVNKYVAKADMIDAQGKEIYAKAADVDKKADRLYVDEALNDKAEAIAVTALMTAVHNKQEKGDYVTKDEMNAMLANTVDEAGVKAIVTALLSSDAVKKMISDAVAEAMSKQ